MTRSNAQRLAQHHSKTLAMGLVLSALIMAAGMMLAPRSSHADTTFVVTSTADPGSGVCDTVCTLREAITAANDTPGRDTINFRLSNTGEARTISPASPLPAVTEAVTIDGYSQLGSSPNTLAKGTNANLLVELDGSNAEGDSVNGLVIKGDDVVVRGLVINRFSDEGIDVFFASGARIEGNFVGTDASGTQDLGNGDSGVLIDSGSGNKVGGTAPEARNLISGNEDDGMLLLLPKDTRVEGNLIVTRKDGVGDLGNAEDGVEIVTSSGNFVGGLSSGAGNTIAFNGGEGITVNPSSPANRILSNPIFSNEGLGIDLDGGTEDAAGVTTNDNRDPDTGANDLQNKPVVTTAVRSGGRTTIRGKLNSTPGDDFTVQFFSNPAATDEGKTFLGQKGVTTDVGGDATFSFSTRKRVAGAVTATATDAGGNTSEFSAPKRVAGRR